MLIPKKMSMRLSSYLNEETSNSVASHGNPAGVAIFVVERDINGNKLINIIASWHGGQPIC